MCNFDIKKVLIEFKQSCEEIIIPEGTTKIEEEAFRGMDELKKVVIPEGITEIGDSAFEECYELETVVLPDSLKKIGDYAFYLCTKLKNINIHENITEIGEVAFNYAFGLADENGFIIINDDLFGYFEKNISLSSRKISKKSAVLLFRKTNISQKL